MKKILWQRSSGVLEVLSPQLLPLIKMQRGRDGYDPAPDLAVVRKGGLSEAGIDAFLTETVDIDWETEKLKSGGATEAQIAGHVAYHEAMRDGGLTLDDAISKIAAKDCAGEGVVAIVEAGVLPASRAYRDAWAHCPEIGCKVDMPKAREIARNRLRAKRQPMLEQLDVRFFRAIEAKADTTKIAAMKQTLRDITVHPALTGAATPDALKAAEDALAQAVATAVAE